MNTNSSPDYELSYDPPSENLALSPASQDLAAFQTYNRTALPFMVEAELQGIIDAQLAPVGRHISGMLVEIVRRCQSVVSENFQSLRGPNLEGANNVTHQRQLAGDTAVHASIVEGVLNTRHSTLPDLNSYFSERTILDIPQEAPRFPPLMLPWKSHYSYRPPR